MSEVVETLAAPDPDCTAARVLRRIVERIEGIEEELATTSWRRGNADDARERRALGCDIKDAFGEARSAGFDEDVLRGLLDARRRGPEKERLLDLYKRAMGM